MTLLEVVQYARLVFAGMLVFVIGYQLWIARVRRTEPILYLVAAWAGAALLMVIGRTVQHATIDPTMVLLGSKIYHTGVLALVPLGFALAHEVRGVPRGRSFWIFATIGSIPIPFVWIGHLIISDRVRVFQTINGPILGPEPAPLAPTVLPYLVMVGLYLAYVARQGRPKLPWHQRISLNVAFFALLPALANDVLLYSGALMTLEIVGLAMFLHVLAINVGVFGRAGELFANLEKTVDERTAELVARERELSDMLAARRRILDAIPDVVCLLRGGRFDYVNQAGERFLGRPVADLVGAPLVDFVVEGQRAEAGRLLAAIDQSPNPTVPADLRFVGPADTERSAEVAGLALDLAGGPGTLVTIRDVTERAQLLAKLQVADRLASVGTLAAGIAHEINNPLMFVSGNLELLQDALDRTPGTPAAASSALRLYLADCATGTKRIAQIVKDLNVFTRADDERSVVDCRPILEYALKIAMVSIRHRAEVIVNYGSTPSVNGDPRRLSQVFLNLLVNAGQSIPEDGTPHSIRVSTWTRADGWAVIEVADTGVGIDPALLPTIFDPFVTTKRLGQGTGLGLFICLGIVTELGGGIQLRPGEPTGTVAQVTLPPAEVGQVRSQEFVPNRRVPRPRSGIKVLIADDDPLVLGVLAQLLRHYSVTAVGGGMEAIRALETESFDIVLCDLMMPGHSGADVWREAQQRGCEDRFVLMTGGATTDALRDYLDGAQVPCVSKPATLAEIEAAFDACLAREGSWGSTPAAS